MSKRNKKKRAISEKINQKCENKTMSPMGFFKNIGIKDLSGEKREHAFCKAGIKEIINYSEANANLDLAKIWWGCDFKHTCLVAEKLAQMDIPSNSKVLDIGGGPGHLAFWLSNVWDKSEITVADKFSNAGSEWAKEIENNSVNFIDSYLPDLKGIEDLNYDVILVSRVLTNISNMTLPESIDTHSMETYLSSDKGEKIMSELEIVANAIKRLLAPNGRVIIVDSWAPDRIFLVCKAFEKSGLFVDFDMFVPHVSKEYSYIVFSEVIGRQFLFDHSLGLSTSMCIENAHVRFNGIAAETIRQIFGLGKQLMLVKQDNKEHSVSVVDEVIEKNGLTLYYRTTTGGVRYAVITTSIDINRYIKDYRENIEKLVSSEKVTIVQQIYPN